MIKEELKSLFQNKILLLVVLVIALIPTVYAGIFLASMWDPYGKVDQLPVAVVNQDQAVEYNGKTLKIGSQMVDNLKTNQSLAFEFVDAQIAKEGLKNGDYYMVITIPKEFSANAATLMDTKPQKMQLTYETNPGTNYIASKLSETAAAKIKSSVAKEVTAVYAQSVFDQIGTIGDGMQTAADGAAALSDGVKTVANGNVVITDNLNRLAENTLVFSDGADTLAVGLKDYTAGVKQVDQGAEKLNVGTAQVKENLPALVNGISALNTGEKQYTDGVAQLDAQSARLNQGTSDMKNGLDQLSNAVSVGTAEQPALLAGAQQLENGLQSLDEQIGSLASDTDTAGNPTLTGGLKSSIAGMQTAAQGMEAASIGIGNASAAISQAGSIMTQMKSGLDGMPQTLEQSMGGYDLIIAELVNEANNQIQAAQAGQQAELIDPNVYMVKSSALTGEIMTNLNGQLDQLTAAEAGLGAIAEGLTSSGGAVETLNQGAAAMSEGVVKLTVGMQSLGTGIETLQGGVDALYAGAQKVNAGVRSVAGYLDQLASGGASLESGMKQYTAGVATLNQKSGELLNGTSQLVTGAEALQTGINSLADGTQTLYNGTQTLTNNNNKINDGISSLADGAGQIQSGSAQLADGSQTLGNGLSEISRGTNTLKNSLSNGAVQIEKTNVSSDNIDMFADPINTSETQLRTVANNGHAMAPYMMSVGLWVGTLAFCLMYPLTKYRGKLQSGVAWWASKAIILYSLSILMGILLILLMGVMDGFAPLELKKTILLACLVSLTFTSIMYFFNSLLGKAGSFLMLVFMVVQLAGSAGTYPVELSPPFVAAIHNYVPFTYTVTAFRSTICGGESIQKSVIVLVTLFVIFTGLTIGEFCYRAKRIENNQPTLLEFLEEKGLA